jgi:hypothetical protein
MKLLFATAGAVAISLIGLTTAQAYPGRQTNPSLTAGPGAGTLQAIDISSAKKKKKKSMRAAGRAGASKAGTGGGAGGESGSGSAARGAQGRGPTR